MNKERKFNIDPSAVNNFDVIVDLTFSILADQFGYYMPALMMIDKKSNALRVVKENTLPGSRKMVKQFFKKDMEMLDFSLELDNNLLIKAVNGKKILTTDTVHNLATPHSTKTFSKALDAFLRCTYYIVIPIICNSEVIGLVVAGAKKKKLPSKTEKALLLKLSEKIGGYIKSSWQIRNLEGSIKELEQKNENLKKLVKLKVDYLKNIHDLFEEFLKETKDNNFHNNVKGALMYLNSLVLLSEIVDKENFYEN